MNEYLLKDLLDQYLTGTITDAGRAELAKMMDDPRYKQALESMVEQTFADGSFTGEESPEIKVAVQEWLHKKVQKRTRVFHIGRMAVAACVIGLAGLAVWFFALKNNPPAEAEIAKTTVPVDIGPGRSGAILTLANGQQLALDSATDGTIAGQAGVSVNKKEGRLHYETSSQAPDDKEVAYNTMITPKGRQYTVVLADGSNVLLNAASSIRFPTSFPGSERVVELNGEAYFEVAKDPRRKFIVIAGNMRTEVLGTHFTINSYNDEARSTATLLEGSIKVSAVGKSELLQPGGQAQVGPGSDITAVKQANLEEATGWINGYFYFEKADVQTVMRQLARWYDIDVRYQGNTTRELFGGKIQRDLNLAAVMDILKTIGLQYKIEGKTLIIGA